MQVLSYVAQIERENIHRRQAEGIAAAKARGKRFGRPKKERPHHYREVVQRYVSGELSKNKPATCLGVARGTFDRWMQEDGLGKP
nr:recombinase family protein [Olsenella profusa]